VIDAGLLISTATGTFPSVAISHFWGLGAAALGIFAAALVAYWREQTRKGTNWILAPLTRALPWNKDDKPLTNQTVILACNFTLVDLYLLDTAGKLARYQKTSRFVVMADEVSSYKEGVAADGTAAEFVSMRGAVVETIKEHGFYISRIDLGETIRKGAQFTNTYSAKLLDCFSNNEEQWSQELAFPTEHLTVRVHFPKGRPPKSVRCKAIEGTVHKWLRQTAQLVELFGRKSIVWELDEPAPHAVFKLEWSW
jgi:hypothetical protein